ncbi:MAG: TlpA family protein disulfide reductase [Candidatus Symbiothrix sp.]|jgi:thiol-disulfide isomerase/thioredoxin|nr:TlpA family protein disulfide reductase [Candidatus Symbiothrix sp.]
MKMKKQHFLFSVFLTVIVLSFFSCKKDQTPVEQLPNPEIKAGTANLSGKVMDYHGEKDEEPPFVYLQVFYPVTAEIMDYETQLAVDGSFYFEEIPIECNTIGFIGSDIFNWTSVGVALISNEETQVKILYDPNNPIQVQYTKNSLLAASDTILCSYELMDNFLHSPGSTRKKYYDMKPEEFRQYAMDRMKEKITFALDGESLPPKAKNWISNEFKLIYLAEVLLDYKDYMSLNYRNFKNEEEPDDFTPQEPDKSYYSFLKEFDLNNSQYLYNQTYSTVLERILRNDTLSIPPIGDTPIDRWMKEVKEILSDLVGFDKGLFYDLLATNSYAQQFNDASRPLSNQQKENITNYFKGKKEEIAKILLNKNKEIEKIAGITAHLKINETPIVPEKELTDPAHDHPKGLLIDSIVARYKGKVVLIDFWATWCSPCLKAMQTSRELKQEMIGKDVIFVYITNSSSPKELWEKKIQGIGGEHYYLENDGEWESISYSDKYEFDGIPTYLIFDTNGVFKHKFTSYPGNDEMRKMLEELIP